MPHNLLKARFPELILIVSVLAALAAAVWLRSGPSWRLSAERTADGSRLTVTTTATVEPVYTVVIKGWSIGQPIGQLSPSDVSNGKAGEVETVFSDETVPPGRWTLKVEDIKLDIMLARLVVNDSLECGPGEILELEIGLLSSPHGVCGLH